jgi:hypothetical protein
MNETTIRKVMALIGARGGLAAAARMSKNARKKRPQTAAAASAKVRAANGKRKTR